MAMSTDAPMALRVIVLCGGPTAEREVSLNSGRCVHQALRSIGMDSTLVVLEDENLAELDCLEFDVIFNAIHGAFGEDGTLQRLCQEKGLILTGCSAEACKKAFNKVTAKQILENNNIPTPAWATVTAKDDCLAAIRQAGLTLPLITKPVCGGSSQGMTLVKDLKELPAAIAMASEYDNNVLVEKVITGRELTIGILEDRALPVLEVRTKREFYTYAAKYDDDDTEYICPAELSPEVSARVQGYALAANNSLGVEEYSRVDVQVDENDNPYVFDINTIPGMTSHSLLPKAAAVVGMDYPQLCMKIIEMAWMR